MAGQDKTFNAKVVGVVDIQAGDANKTVANLLKIQQDITHELKKTSDQAIATYGEVGAGKKTFEDVKKEVKLLADNLKLVGMTAKSVKLLNVDDVKNAEELEKRIKAISRAYDTAVKQSQMSKGTFGLDIQDPQKAITALKKLEEASKAVKYAMESRPNDATSLAKEKAVIEANTQALIRHIDTLRQQMAVEEAHAKALRANAEFDKKRAKERSDIQAKAIAENIARDKAEEKRQADAEAKRLKDFQSRMAAQKAAEEQAEARRARAQSDLQYRQTNSATAQNQLNRDRFDFTPTARAAGAYQFQVQTDRASLLANPAYQALDMQRRKRAEEERVLAEIYKSANTKPEMSGFYKLQSQDTGNQARVESAQRILQLQRELVTLQQRGQLTDAESLRLRGLISQEVAAEVRERARANNLQAQADQAQRNMARVRGQGGASLLAVQASLMANYAILNGFTGSIQHAISSSVELEAQFKNVQAVTGTTSTEMEGLKDRIEKVAAASKFSSAEVAGAALTLGQAGLSAREVGQAIESVSMLAAASGTSLAQSVDLVTSVIGVFDKTSSDTGDIANKITAAANNSKVSVDKLALGFQYAGNMAAQAGISFEETTAAMSAMSNAGIRSGSTMGTGLRQFIIETQKPSQEFLNTISRIGLSMADLDFKSHGLVGVATRLREAGFVASDAIKSFDVRGAAAFNALIANPDELERQYSLLQNTKAGLKANEIQMDSLKSQATRLGTSLENLASVGLQPVSHFLQILVDKSASAVQWMAEHETAARVLGTVLSTTLAAAMTVHVASLVRGAAAMVTWATAATGASAAASRSMTVLGASQAVWGALTAAWNGAAAVFRGTATAATTSAAVTGAAMNGLATVVARTTVAVEGFFASLLATPVAPLVAGLALAAGAYYMLSDSASKSKEAIDKAEAAASEAKGAYDQHTKAVDSLNAKITDLTYKQHEKKVSDEELKNTALDLNAQFGTLGLSIDSNTKSYAEMLSKMRQVRTEMENLSQAKMRVALDENAKLAKTQQAEVESTFGSLRSKGLQPLDTAIRNGNFSQGQRSLIDRVSNDMTNGKVSDPTSLENVRTLINQALDNAKSKGLSGSTDAKALEKFSENLGKLVRNVSDLEITKSQGLGLQREGANREADIKYRQRQFQVDGKPMALETIMDTFGGNLRAKSTTTGNALKDFDTFRENALREIDALNSVKDQLAQDKGQNGVNPQANSNAMIAVNQKIEGIKTSVQSFAAETQAKAKIAFANESRVNKALQGSKDKAVAAGAIRDQTELEKKFNTRGLVDRDEIQAEELSRQEAGDIRANNKLTSGAGKDHTAEIEAGIKERVAKAQEAAALRAAQNDKLEASLSQDADLVAKLYQSGQQKIQDARKAALKALDQKQTKDKEKFKGNVPDGMDAVWAEERAALNDNFNQQLRNFTDSFKGFGAVVAARLKAWDDAITRRRQDIEEQKVSGDDRVYEAGAGLRELELMQALGKKTREKNFQSSTTYDYSTQEGRKADGTANDMGVSTTIGPKGVAISSMSKGSDGAAYGGGTANARGNSAGIGSQLPYDPALGSTGLGTLKQRIAREQLNVSKIELEENDKYLTSLNELIADLQNRYKAAKEAFDRTASRIKELEDKQNSKEGLTDAEKTELTQKRGDYKVQSEYVGTAQKDLNSAVRDRRSARTENENIQIKIAQYTKAMPTEMTLDNVKKKIEEVAYTWAETVQEMDATKVLGDGVAGILGNITGQIGNSFSSVLSGTKSIKSAFKDMATSVIKSMLDIMAQAAAMQAVKGIMGFMGFGAGAGLAGAGSAGATMTFGAEAMPELPFLATIATGGYVLPSGGIERVAPPKVQRFANGGSVMGGVQGRDSVPAMVMPGEYILKKKAVDAIGTDYLHSLNQATNSVVSSSSAITTGQQQQQGTGGVVNVWVVSEDQKPATMGAKDVVVAIADDISRGGSIKKLIKQVATNQM